MLDEAFQQPVARPARSNGPDPSVDGGDLARKALVGGRRIQQGTPLDEVADWLVRLAAADDRALRLARRQLVQQAESARADDAVHPALAAVQLAESRTAWADTASV